MKLNLKLIRFLFLSTLACQNNNKTTENSLATTEVLKAEKVFPHKPGLSLGILGVKEEYLEASFDKI